MKERYSKTWFPFWSDKWLYGSMRIEFNTEERGVWVDFMAIANKDDGFIRANEDIPYPITQLAGMLIIPEPVLKSAIDKFIKKDKITQCENGVLYITTWEKYKFSDRHKRRIKETKPDHNSPKKEKKDIVSENSDIYSNSKSNNKSKRIEYKYTDSEIEKHFNAFWESYPHKMAKQDAFKAFKVLIKKEGIEIIASATNGYNGHLKAQRVKKGIDMKEQMDYIMYPASFLRKEKWRDFIGVVYKPKL